MAAINKDYKVRGGKKKRFMGFERTEGNMKIEVINHYDLNAVVTVKNTDTKQEGILSCAPKPSEVQDTIERLKQSLSHK